MNEDISSFGFQPDKVGIDQHLEMLACALPTNPEITGDRLDRAVETGCQALDDLKSNWIAERSKRVCDGD